MGNKKANAKQPEVKPAADAASTEVTTPPVQSTEQKLAKAEAENQTLLAVNQELQTKLETTEKQKASTLPSVMIDGVLVEISVPKFSFEGKEYTAQELAENTKLAADLKKIGANVFKVSEEA